MEEGYTLVERDMIPGGSFGSKTYQPAYYAELVRTDEQPQKDATLTTLDALRIVREFCDDHKCDNTCPLIEFCERHMAEGEGPTDWYSQGKHLKKVCDQDGQGYTILHGGRAFFVETKWTRGGVLRAGHGSGPGQSP